MSKWQINDHKTSITFNDEEKATRRCWVSCGGLREAERRTILEFLPSIFIAQFFKSSPRFCRFNALLSLYRGLLDANYWNPEFLNRRERESQQLCGWNISLSRGILFTVAGTLHTSLNAAHERPRGDKSAIKFLNWNVADCRYEDEIFPPSSCLWQTCR